jgi:predicted amidohydrolase
MQLTAAARFEPKLGALDRNLQVAKQLCFEACETGARLVVLPELCLSGAPSNKREAFDVSQPRDNVFVDQLTEACSRNNSFVAFGFVELAYGKLYNSAGLVGPQGLLACVRKRNLSGRDFMWANEGTLTFPSVVTPLGRVGLLVGDDSKNGLLETHPAFLPAAKFYAPGSVDIACILTCSDSDAPLAEWIHLAQSLGGSAVVGNSSGRGQPCVISSGQAWVPDDSLGPCVVGGYVL